MDPRILNTQKLHYLKRDSKFPSLTILMPEFDDFVLAIAIQAEKTRL